ncbi:hypothetical protein BDFB_012439 [Asbolus verrucosus]|uniref:DUF5641 domain-containing protein n=1 Tax=Asbolus verrucosus TaxID=1661398 RepID=A0A482W0Q3_ASBVE|nr:hypothetical protein BDFB_012439 [Asbolus verrucosus]
MEPGTPHFTPKSKQTAASATTPLEAGTMVVLVDDNTPPLSRRIGRVTQLHPGSDGITGVVSIRTGNGNVCDSARVIFSNYFML